MSFSSNDVRICLLCWTMLILTSTVMPVQSSICVVVEHSERYPLNGRFYDARMNKCVLRPSYTVKSEIVESPNTPVLLKEGHTCCCNVTDKRLQSPTIGNIQIRFQEVLSCECVKCPN